MLFELFEQTPLNIAIWCCKICDFNERTGLNEWLAESESLISLKVWFGPKGRKVQFLAFNVRRDAAFTQVNTSNWRIISTIIFCACFGKLTAIGTQCQQNSGLGIQKLYCLFWAEFRRFSNAWICCGNTHWPFLCEFIVPIQALWALGNVDFLVTIWPFFKNISVLCKLFLIFETSVTLPYVNQMSDDG